MMAEIFGRTTGLCKGKGGHMHLFDPETHFPCSCIIAEGYPVACGQGLAFMSCRVVTAFSFRVEAL